MALARRCALGLLSHFRSHSCLFTSAAANGGKLLDSTWTSLRGTHPAYFPSLTANFRTSHAHLSNVADQDVLPDDGARVKMENEITDGVISRVNESISQREVGRLFAVVHVAGKQFKVTDGDLIVVQGHWPPTIGEQINLEKVLLAGSADFTLLGRPVLDPGMVSVEATVVEKSLSHTKTFFYKRKRKNYRRINFCRVPLTTLRINRVRLQKTVSDS